MSNITISDQHSIYILAAVLIAAITLFIAGFYSGTLMSAQTLKSATSDVQSSEVNVSEVNVSEVKTSEVKTSEVKTSEDTTTAQLEQPDIINELTEKEPPVTGTGTTSAKPPASEPPVIKASTDSDPVQHIDIPDDNTKIAMANNITQGDFGTVHEVTDEEPTEDCIMHRPSVENNAKVNNKSNNTNPLYSIQVGSFSKESNAIKFNDLLITKGYNTRNEVFMSSNKTPKKKYKVYIGFFASQDAAIKEAYAYTVKEKLSSYVVPSHAWETSNDKNNKSGQNNKGVYIDYGSIKQVKNL